MHFHIVTLFPESFESYLGASIIGRAIQDKKITVSFYDPKDFCIGKKRADDKPYGGGPGMVMRAEPVIKAIAKAKGRKKKVKIIFTSPHGKEFTNTYAQKVQKEYKDVIIVCGRYEGIDARIKKVFRMDEVSIGNYVLTGGELPALVMMDVISRRVEGVLGTHESLEEKRIAAKDVYTRPEVLTYKKKNYRVPKVLLSGHHGRIDEERSKK